MNQSRQPDFSSWRAAPRPVGPAPRIKKSCCPAAFIFTLEHQHERNKATLQPEIGTEYNPSMDSDHVRSFPWPANKGVISHVMTTQTWWADRTKESYRN